MRLAALAEVATINPPLVCSAPDAEEVAFLPMAGVLAESSTAVPSETRQFSAVRNGFSYFQNNDILVAKITPCFENGKIAQVQFQQLHGFGSTEFHVIRADSKRLNARYAVHFLRQPNIRLEGERKMTGSAGQRRVPRHFLEGLSIPLPPLPEQRRIAAILDQAEALRAKRREALRKLEGLAQAVFVEMFGDPVRNPKGWPRLPFGEVLESIDSGKSPICLDRPAADHECGILKLGAVTRCEFDPEQNKALPPGIKLDKELEVRNGDVLFTRKNTYDLVAACAVVGSARPGLFLPDLIFRLSLKKKTGISATYIHQLLINKSKRKEIQKLAGGSAGSMPNISKERLRNAHIEVPPFEMQECYARRVKTIDKMKSAHRASLAKLDALFASLQYRAFRGEL